MILLNLAWSLAAFQNGNVPMPTPKPSSLDVYTSTVFPGVEFYSQVGQDEAVYYLVHGHPNGTFIDIGAYNGVTISNTIFFERHLDWKGICVEAIDTPKLTGNIRQHRLCKLYTNAAWDKDDETIEILNIQRGQEAFAGNADVMLDFQLERLKQMESFLDSPEGNKWTQDKLNPNFDVFSPTVKMPVQTKKVSTMLDESNMPIIDFMSIDIEGAELKALQGFDFTRHVANIIIIEDNHYLAKIPHDQNPVRLLIENTGLYSSAITWDCEVIYVRKYPIWSWEAKRRNLIN